MNPCSRWNQPQNHLKPGWRHIGNQCGLLGPLVPCLALTTGQDFVFAVVGLVFVVVILVWPAVRKADTGIDHSHARQSRRRLLREIRRHE